MNSSEMCMVFGVNSYHCPVKQAGSGPATRRHCLNVPISLPCHTTRITSMMLTTISWWLQIRVASVLCIAANDVGKVVQRSCWLTHTHSSSALTRTCECILFHPRPDQQRPNKRCASDEPCRTPCEVPLPGQLCQASPQRRFRGPKSSDIRLVLSIRSG